MEWSLSARGAEGEPVSLFAVSQASGTTFNNDTVFM